MKRAAIGTHSTATTDEAWDGPANKARLKSGESEAYYRKAFAWKDPDGESDTKAGYRFIHHMVSADGEPGAASTRGCTAGIGVLNGARGGTTIPEADRAGVYRHLAAHLRDADIDPPELKAIPEPPGLIRRKVPAKVTLRTVADSERELSMGVGEEGGILIPDAPTVIELFIPYNQETRLWWFREVIRPGFFSRAIKEKQDVVSWYQHGEGGQLPLGRTTAGTLALRETTDGLVALADPPDTQAAKGVLTAIERGEVNGASFAFEMLYDDKGRPLGERWVEEPGQDPLRELIDAIIWDVSPVVFPAYSDSDTEIKESAQRAYTEYRATHPAAGQVAPPAGDTNQDDDDQVADVDQRARELAALRARYTIP